MLRLNNANLIVPANCVTTQFAWENLGVLRAGGIRTEAETGEESALDSMLKELFYPSTSHT
jgi:hypothetical protein